MGRWLDRRVAEWLGGRVGGWLAGVGACVDGFVWWVRWLGLLGWFLGWESGWVGGLAGG